MTVQGGDRLHILDLTSATEVFTEEIVAATGGGGQTPHMEWSGDSRTLAMVVLETAKSDADGVGELQLLRVRADGRMETAAAPIDLPGPFVGVDRTATTVLAESSSGAILTRRAQTGVWAAPVPRPGPPGWTRRRCTQRGGGPKAITASRPTGSGSPGCRSPAASSAARRPSDGSASRPVSGPLGPSGAMHRAWAGAVMSCSSPFVGTSATDVVAVDPAGVQRVLVTYAVGELAARTLSAPSVHLALDRFQR